jgi:hypothetical protein
MSRRRRRGREVVLAVPASTIAFWSVILNGFFVLVFGAGAAGFAWLALSGHWRSPFELAGWIVLEALALTGVAFFADGIRRDLRQVGWTARGELRSLVGRWRRSSARPGGRESFASQRFTGNARRRR